MNKQLEYLTNTKSQFVELVGDMKTEDIFNKALFYVTIGSNDYINNYLLTGSATSQQYTPQQYQDVLIAAFKSQLTVWKFNSIQIFPFTAQNCTTLGTKRPILDRCKNISVFLNVQVSHLQVCQISTKKTHTKQEEKEK